MLTFSAPGRPNLLLLGALGLALLVGLPICALLVWRIHLDGWPWALGVMGVLWLVGWFLYLRGRRFPFETPMGLGISADAIVALAGQNQVWFIDWADLDRVELGEEAAPGSPSRPVLRLSARGGGKSQLIVVKSSSFDGFEVTVDARLVSEPLPRLATLLRWYRDHPESREELKRTACIRHRMDSLAP